MRCTSVHALANGCDGMKLSPKLGHAFVGSLLLRERVSADNMGRRFDKNAQKKKKKKKKKKKSTL